MIAVRASSSIPGVFPPVAWDGMLLCDIGVFEAVPAITARHHAKDLAIAVDVSNGIAPIEGCKNILEVFNGSKAWPSTNSGITVLDMPTW